MRAGAAQSSLLSYAFISVPSGYRWNPRVGFEVASKYKDVWEANTWDARTYRAGGKKKLSLWLLLRMWRGTESPAGSSPAPGGGGGGHILFAGGGGIH